MPIPFERLGACFNLCSVLFYPGAAKKHLVTLIRQAETSGLVIDLGGGTGVMLNLAHQVRSDLTYICVDPAIGMLKYVRPFAYRVAARSEDMPFRDNTVAAVMIGDAIHHFSNPERGITEVHRILKSRGKLFIFDINPKILPGRIALAIERLLGESAHFYAPEQLANLLAKKGFKVLVPGKGGRYTLEAEKH